MAIPKEVKGSQFSRVRKGRKAARQPPLDNHKLSNGHTISYAIFEGALNRLAPGNSKSAKRTMTFDEWWTDTKATLKEYKAKCAYRLQEAGMIAIFSLLWVIDGATVCRWAMYYYNEMLADDREL